MRFLLLAALAVSLPLATSVQAAPQETRNSGNLFAQFDEAIGAKRYAEALKIANSLPSDSGDADSRALVLSMRAAALMGLNRDPEAQRLISAALALKPTEYGSDDVILWGGIDAEKYDFSIAALDRLIAAHPDKVRELPDDVVRFLLSKAPKADKKLDDDRRLALARIHFGSRVYPDRYADQALRILMDRGDVKGAEALLPSVDSVESLQRMLVLRRYEPLWLKIAAQVGPHMTSARADEIERLRKLLADNPEQADVLSAYITALSSAGELGRAIELRTALPSTREGMAAIDGDHAWMVNNIAYALHKNGEAEEADRLFALLNESADPKGGWRINMFINRLDLLVADGKFAQAEPLIEETERLAVKEGSDYARQLVRRMKFCTKHRLGRTSEAATARKAMMEHAKDATMPTFEALMCAGDVDGAEALTRQFSDEESFQRDFVRSLQRRPLFDVDPSVWNKSFAALRERPYFRDTFDRLGRDMPDDLYFTVGQPASK